MPENTKDRPLAVAGLISYRYPNQYGGYFMIGAKDDQDALREARRSTSNDVVMDRLERWNENKYMPVAPSPSASEQAVPVASESRQMVVVDGSGRVFSLRGRKIANNEPEGWEKAFELFDAQGKRDGFFRYRDDLDHFIVTHKRYEFSPRVSDATLVSPEAAENFKKYLEIEQPAHCPYRVLTLQNSMTEKFAKEVQSMLWDEKEVIPLQWESGREAKTLDEAKELAGVALTKLGVPEPVWKAGTAGWEYAQYAAKFDKMVVGASDGGVVSIDGDPFTPGKRQTNVTLERVMESMERPVSQMKTKWAAELTKSDEKAETVSALMADLDAWGQTSRRHADTLVANRLIVLDRHERAFSSDTEENGKVVPNLRLPKPDFQGVTFLTPESAEKVCDELQRQNPEDGPYVARDAYEYAEKKHADILRFLNKNCRERVYEWPSGFVRQAEDQFRMMLHERFTPKWEDGLRDSDGHPRYAITIPAHEVPQLRMLQKAHPARWGNPPEVAKELADNHRQLEESSMKNSAKYNFLTPEQKEFVDILCIETNSDPFVPSMPKNLNFGNVLELNERLHELAAQHLKLSLMSVETGLSRRQEQAQQAIAQEVKELLDGVPGIKGAHVMGDPRGNTIGVYFESGRSTSLTGSYKVPVDPQRLLVLNGEAFWDAYPVKPEYLELTIATDSAAFDDLGHDQEVANIFEDAADKIEKECSYGGKGLGLNDGLTLRDRNGNMVGCVEVTTNPGTGGLLEGNVRLAIELDKAASDGDALRDASNLLRETAATLLEGHGSTAVAAENRGWCGWNAFAVYAERDGKTKAVGQFECRLTAAEYERSLAAASSSDDHDIGG